MTLYPVTGGAQSLPQDLVRFLHQEFSAEILRGGTYPMEEPLPLQQFADYWFGTFAVLAIMDDVNGGEGLAEGRDWESVCLGTFYIKPNYPGMSFCSTIYGAFYVLLLIKLSQDVALISVMLASLLPPRHAAKVSATPWEKPI
jgi:hypothetical protein